jgi:hypothetical protein
VTPAIAAVLILLTTFVWSVFKRRRAAKWILLALLVVLVSEGTSMNNAYRTQYPTPAMHSGGCGGMGGGYAGGC